MASGCRLSLSVRSWRPPRSATPEGKFLSAISLVLVQCATQIEPLSGYVMRGVETEPDDTGSDLGDFGAAPQGYAARSLVEKGLEIAPSLDAREIRLRRSLHLGIHHAGSNAVHQHSERRKSDRCGTGNSVDARFARRIGRI